LQALRTPKVHASGTIWIVTCVLFIVETWLAVSILISFYLIGLEVFEGEHVDRSWLKFALFWPYYVIPAVADEILEIILDYKF